MLMPINDNKLGKEKTSDGKGQIFQAKVWLLKSNKGKKLVDNIFP
jgi:hypothetical protein